MGKNIYKTKYFGSNKNISNKEIIVQQTQRTTMVNAPKLRKQQSIVNVKGNITPVKLPTIAKKTVTTSKYFSY